MNIKTNICMYVGYMYEMSHKMISHIIAAKIQFEQQQKVNETKTNAKNSNDSWLHCDNNWLKLHTSRKFYFANCDLEHISSIVIPIVRLEIPYLGCARHGIE